MTSNLSTVAYIGATILFILSLGGLSNQETARRGNLYGMVGMTWPFWPPCWVLKSLLQGHLGLWVVWSWAALLACTLHGLCK